tara:strand:- start:1694 stop:1882 length:189 start_codon:yes stop_codon:yes gene_type:complete
MIKNRNWFLKSFFGIVIFSAGLCVFGEALTLKNSEQSWFFTGTIALVMINSGLCLMISANFK